MQGSVLRRLAGLAARVLAELGLDRRRLLAEVETLAPEQVVGSAPEPTAVGYTPLAQAAIDRATIEARQRSHTPVGTGHLFLALLELPDSHAPKLLARVGYSANAVRSALEPRLGEGVPS